MSYFLISLGALAVSSWIFGRLDPLHPQFQLFAFLLGFIGITYFGWLPLFLPEFFPTRVRSTGTGHFIQHGASRGGDGGALGWDSYSISSPGTMPRWDCNRADLRCRHDRDLVGRWPIERPPGGLMWKRLASLGSA